MLLLGLLRRLHDESVPQTEKAVIQRKVKQLEAEMGLESLADDS